MLTIQIGGGWSTARQASLRPAAVPWGATTPLTLDAQAAWQHGAGRDLAGELPWGVLATKDLHGTGQWQQAAAADRQPAAGPWSRVPAKDCALVGGWDRSIRPRDICLRLIYNPAPAWKDATVRGPSRRVDAFGPRYDAAGALQASLYIPGTLPLAFSFGGRAYFPPTSPLVFFDFRYVPAAPRIQPVDSALGGVRWQDARRLNLQARLPWGRARVLDGKITGIEYPDYPGPIKELPAPPTDPELLETYMIANTVNLVVLPSRTPVEAKNVRVSLDADSFSWKFSADIFTQAALDLVKPDAEGAREIEVDINGWVWVVMVERYGRNLKFASEAYSISGASRTQLLAGPYAPLRTSLNNAPITAMQAATAELLYTGFTLNWDAANVGPADWTFPAGAFSYQGQTAMQVIARIAETVGAVVRPSRSTDALEVRPRYVAPPWEWSSPATPIDRIIPPVMMTELSGEWTPQPAWNACYVSGTSHGVSMLVRRAGTAGDNPAPDVFDDWLTGQEANQARGLHELSKGGNIEIVGVTIPLFPFNDDKGVGLVLPAMLCRVPEASGTWHGVCLSVDISAEGTGAARVTQQLKLERHH